MRLRTPLLAFALAGAGLLSIGSPGPASAGSGRTVVLRDIEFKPEVVRVQAGGRVTWRFQDPYVAHNVTSRGKQRFKSSGSRQEGATYSVRFPKRGTFKYVCTIHANMSGRVVVR